MREQDKACVQCSLRFGGSLGGLWMSPPEGGARAAPVLGRTNGCYTWAVTLKSDLSKTYSHFTEETLRSPLRCQLLPGGAGSDHRLQSSCLRRSHVSLDPPGTFGVSHGGAFHPALRLLRFHLYPVPQASFLCLSCSTLWLHRLPSALE